MQRYDRWHPWPPMRAHHNYGTMLHLVILPNRQVKFQSWIEAASLMTPGCHNSVVMTTKFKKTLRVLTALLT